jgi:hypothetical protein
VTDLAVSGFCPCEAKLSSKQGVVNREEGDEIRESGKLRIVSAYLKRANATMFLIVTRSRDVMRA